MARRQAEPEHEVVGIEFGIENERFCGAKDLWQIVPASGIESVMPQTSRRHLETGAIVLGVLAHASHGHATHLRQIFSAESTASLVRFSMRRS